MRTDKYVKNEDLIGKTVEVSATYIKNGYMNANTIKTMLFTDVTYNGEVIIDHVWVKDENNKFTDALKAKQHKQVKMKIKLVKLIKPHTITENKYDLGVVLKELL